MQQRGYDRNTAAGLIIGGCSLAPIIPPSLLGIGVIILFPGIATWLPCIVG